MNKPREKDKFCMISPTCEIFLKINRTHTHTHTWIQRTDWWLPEEKGSGEKTKWIKRVYGDGWKLDFLVESTLLCIKLSIYYVVRIL